MPGLGGRKTDAGCSRFEARELVATPTPLRSLRISQKRDLLVLMILSAGEPEG
jgi:hypothetical protein